MENPVRQQAAACAVALPEPGAFQLRDYQVDIADRAVELLQKYHLAYLSVQVRCGKSLMSLEAARKYGAKRVLFVTKLKAIPSIEGDFASLNPGYKLTTTNYESLHKLNDKFDFVIIDESHSLGQFPIIANRTLALKKICEGLPIIYLSGTPTPESHSQIYHQFFVSTFSPFAEYKNFYKWAADYVDKRVKFVFNRQINDYSHARKDKIDEKCAHLFISFTQEQAGFTAYVREEILHVKMKDSTYDLAKLLIKRRVYEGKMGQVILADTEVSLMQKLHQMYSGTVILEDGASMVFDRSKAEFIRDYFKGQKIAIFYKYKAEYGAILWAFGNDRLTSDPQEFNANDNLIFCCQVQSGREGINLATADALVFYNIDFSAVSYWQSRARMQVRDRVKEALLYWIFSEKGIEDKIYQAVLKKKNYTTSYFTKDFNL